MTPSPSSIRESTRHYTDTKQKNTSAEGLIQPRLASLHSLEVAAERFYTRNSVSCTKHFDWLTFYLWLFDWLIRTSSRVLNGLALNAGTMRGNDWLENMWWYIIGLVFSLLEVVDGIESELNLVYLMIR
mmetsp:Transcript_11867/g.21471  ORF Transcript_11867/g.21471 Transcript_11867/m.21471 type:complete len:129 (+) Transcript_11867:2-388(+)